jgi:hypothetical protein
MSMAKANNGYLGVTEPISLGGPTEKDVVQAAEVEKVRFQNQIITKEMFQFLPFTLASRDVCFLPVS